MDLFSEGCLMDFDIRDWPMSFQKQKSFVLKTVFLYLAFACVRESARNRDMGDGM